MGDVHTCGLPELSRTQQAVQMVLRERISKAEAARRVGLHPTGVSSTMRKMGMGGTTQAGRKAMASNGRGPMSPDRLKRHTERIRREAALYRKKCGIDVDRIISLHIDDGKTYGQIAKMCSVTRCQVAGYIHRHKIAQAKMAKEIADG